MLVWGMQFAVAETFIDREGSQLHCSFELYANMGFGSQRYSGEVRSLESQNSSRIATRLTALENGHSALNA